MSNNNNNSGNQLRCLSLLSDVDYSGNNLDINRYEQERLYFLLSLISSRDQIAIHLDYKHDKVIPIGITFSHIFILSSLNSLNGIHRIHALKINSKLEIPTPFKKHRSSEDFISPWATYPELIKGMKNSCAFWNLVSIITIDRIVVLDVSNNWKLSYSVKGNFNHVKYCKMNRINLVIVEVNSKTKTSILNVIRLTGEKDGKVLKYKFNDEVTSIELPEELSNFSINNIFVSCKKSKNTITLTVKENKTIIKSDSFLLWPRALENKFRETTSIFYRFGNMAQTSFNDIVLHYNTYNGKLVPSLLNLKSNIIHCEFVGLGYSMIYTANHAIYICDQNSQLVYTFNNEETCSLANNFSYSRFDKPIDFASFPYVSMKLFVNKLICLLPNGSVIFIKKEKNSQQQQQLITYNNSTTSSSSSSSSSSSKQPRNFLLLEQ